MSKQTTIPFAPFKPEQLTANRHNLRNIIKRDSEEIMKIPVKLLVVRESKTKKFNPRDKDNYGEIGELAASIRKFGQLTAGRVMALADGRFAVVVGHRRVEALQLIEDQDRTEEFFRAVINPAKTAESTLLLQSLISQTERPLKQHEIAEAYQRLIIDGMTQVEIAEYTGNTPSYVSQMLKFAKEPQQIKDHVKWGNLSVNSAMKLAKKIPDAEKRVEAIQTAEEKKWDASEKRKEKQADKFVYDDDMKRYVPKDKATAEDKENTVKKEDNQIKGARLSVKEIAVSNTVIIPTIRSIEKEIKALPAPEGTPEFNKGYAACLKAILPLFKSKNGEAAQES